VFQLTADGTQNIIYSLIGTIDSPLPPGISIDKDMIRLIVPADLPFDNLSFLYQSSKQLWISISNRLH
jgi:hypothetical protein